MKKLPTIFLILSVVTGVSVALAQPAHINSLSGQLVHGQAVTAFGENFGQKAQAQPVLYDTVDNQPVYDGVSDGALVPVGAGYPWVLNGTDSTSHDHTYLSRSRPHRGKRSAHYSAGVKGFLTGPDLGGAEVPRFYASWWFKTSHDITCGPGGCASTKLIRVWEDGGGEHARFSWTGEQITGGCGWGFPDSINIWTGWDGILNEWNRLEVFLDGPAGLVRLITNSDVKVDTNAYVSNGHYLNRIWRIGLDPSVPQNLDPGLMFDFGEIYVDSTPARVEICQGASWASRGHCEIQPATLWDVSGITFAFNQGSFADRSSAYLYVVNDAGVAGDPFMVSIAAAGDTVAPAAPVGLRSGS